MLHKALLGLAAGTSALLCANAAHAQNYYLGQVILVGYDFCPAGTADAVGTELPIAGNAALYSLYGNAFGSSSEDSFRLPDMQGRSPVNSGQAPGRSDYVRGQMSGAADVQFNAYNMPAHSHLGYIRAVAAAPNYESPRGAALPDFPTGQNIYVKDVVPTYEMAPYTAVLDVSPGGSQPIRVLSPVLALRYCVVTSGIYPPQN